MLYIGMRKTSGKFEAFSAQHTPTEQLYRTIYSYVVGPFRTKRAQLWAVQYGKNNPHFQHVNDAERLCKVA